ncbi:hypothetical protein SAY87_006512 [Trapa incisa]|uniref:Tetraspanin-8 n=1 Tax=Trapa incisa TaxID=236973 RepID=A0AAN7K2H6_9MYRT|nr:hypothetical protein SAY87_006512 [Trapa incisa]
MVRVSNALIGTLNVLSAVFSLFAVGFSLYLHIHGGSTCYQFMETPLLITGVVLLAVSIMGLIGSCGKINFFMYIYLTVLFICIVGLIGFTVFAFIVTNAGAGKVVSGRGFKEYRLGDYSNWLQNHVVKGKRWERIRTCLAESEACSSLASQGSLTLALFNKKNLSPIESGCCKPPVECGFTFKNSTYWTIPKSGPAVADSDCNTWSNQQNALCFNCNSCKAGFLGNIKKRWKNLLIFNICLILFVIIVYSIGCCASRDNRSRRKYGRYGGIA